MKVLLAIDSSAASQVALAEAIARPWPPDSSFEAICVVEPSHLWTTSETAQEAARCAEETVRRAVEKLRAVYPNSSGEAVTGDPKTAILDRATGISADLIVCGSHGRSAVGRLLIGSTATALLRYATCSVEIVRPRADRDGGYRILLATDGSEYSEHAARSIAARPWPSGAQVRVLSIVEILLPAMRAMLEPPFLDDEYLETAREAAMKRSQDAIAQAREILAPTGLDVSESVSVLVDPPRTTIPNEAAEWGADLIVLGSHGRSGVDRFLLGSVSEAVAIGAPCSVEVVRRGS